MKDQATTKKVRAALDKRYGLGNVTFYRSPSGYYYFGGSKGCFISSLYYFNLEGISLDMILDHVAEEITK